MHVKDAVRKRRAYRSLERIEITDEILAELAGAARLAPSCFNNQPWRFVFVRLPDRLKDLHEALTSNNEWAKAASLIIAVFSRERDDCVIKSRIYHRFDTGMGVGFLILRATELGLVAHPIAGFSPRKVRRALGIPDEYQVITLIIVGRRADGIGPLLSEKQAAVEKRRPRRKPVGEFVFLDRFGEPFKAPAK